MKLLFDGYWLVNGPPSGKTVVREMVQTWCHEFPDDEIIMLVRQADRSEVEKLEFVRASEITLLDTRVPIHGLAVTTMRLPRDVDAVVTQNFTPLVRHRATKATFLHDGIFKEHPAWFTAKERIYLSLATMSLRAASLVLTSTVTESRRIRRYFPGASRKTVAVGLGLPSWANSQGDDVNEVRNKRPRPYLLAVGRLNVRKNLQALVEAYKTSPSVKAKFDLIIVGEPNGKSDATDRTYSSIHFLSGVKDAELRDLYRGAAGFIFPSLDEGFGLPLIEAASFGIPIAASDIDVFREIDLASVYFDPKDNTSISDGLNQLINFDPQSDMNEYQVKINRALGKYNWATVVRDVRRSLEMEVQG
ncbi:glycosyltransferase family 4 protein [Arthrobacter sp. FW305-123]|nr:glycosyltransferase family 4 protein [Arthrobacter sp. FW305-123]